MNILYLLVPLALILAGLGVWGFWWAVRDGQFDDVDTPALRILLDEEGASGGVDDTQRKPR
jgi:cbb3-type cytochrome oxidase maturation protein